MLDLTLQGDNRNVDMLVGDIYGRDYEKIGLGTEVIASSMAKPIMKIKEGEGMEDSKQKYGFFFCFLLVALTYALL